MPVTTAARPIRPLVPEDLKDRPLDHLAKAATAMLAPFTTIASAEIRVVPLPAYGRAVTSQCRLFCALRVRRRQPPAPAGPERLAGGQHRRSYFGDGRLLPPAARFSAVESGSSWALSQLVVPGIFEHADGRRFLRVRGRREYLSAHGGDERDAAVAKNERHRRLFQ